MILVAAPLYHKNALNAIKQGLTAGATLSLLPQFNVERYIEAIGRYRCTVISGVPTMMSMVLARTRPARTHRYVLGAHDHDGLGAVLAAAASRELKLAFPECRAAGRLRRDRRRPGAARPAPGRQAAPGRLDRRALSRHRSEARRRIRAEMKASWSCATPASCSAYHNLPEETAKRIRDGWYYTGDVCRRDADGFYYFVGRTDDMFVCGGENIFPIEVETLLERHPAVHQAYVMPFEHEMKGQVPYAFVVLRAGAQRDEDELKQFALANGPAYQHPRRVFFLDQLPLAGTNKIDREQLRRLVAADR